MLKKNIGDESQALQDQIKAKLLVSDPKRAKELEEDAQKKAEKLVTLLNNQAETKKMRDEQKFNFTYLSAEKNVTIQDCDNLFKYAKILFEQ